MKKVCVLGGGASGLMCACFANESTMVTVVEENSKSGKKILATGNGRCNLSNVNMNKCSYNCNIDEYLKLFSQKDTIAFFKQIGLETYVDEQGRVYPFSMSASSVLEVLVNFLNQKKNVKIVTNKQFTGLKKESGGFRVYFADSSEYFDEVVVALGNKANLSEFDNLGIKTKQFVPSLCGLKTKKNKVLAGVRVSNVLVKCPSVNFEEIGEILFREDGVSGIVIFNLSAFLARVGNFNAKIYVDFLPNKSVQDVIFLLNNRKALLHNYKVDNFLTGFFNKNVNFNLLTRIGVNLEKTVCDLSEQEIINLATEIKNYKIDCFGSLNNNQVFSGGVCLDGLSEHLESLKMPALFFVGEVVDVDGVCGGYNLQWAWTSGKIVGENL